MRMILLILFVQTLQAQTGDAAISSVDASSDNWKNWTFATVSAITAAAGILVVSIDNGTSAH